MIAITFRFSWFFFLHHVFDSVFFLYYCTVWPVFWSRFGLHQVKYLRQKTLKNTRYCGYVHPKVWKRAIFWTAFCCCLVVGWRWRRYFGCHPLLLELYSRLLGWRSERGTDAAVTYFSASENRDALTAAHPLMKRISEWMKRLLFSLMNWSAVPLDHSKDSLARTGNLPLLLTDFSEVLGSSS